jgi:DNA invertase Pin-like site-specific DNA recombinase
MVELNKNMKAAVYCRVGTYPQAVFGEHGKTAIYCRTAVNDVFKIQGQEERLRHFAAENGHENIICYIDNGESGTTLDRPAMNRLLSDIRGGNVNTVLTKDIARIARGYVPFSEFIAEARKHNVKVVTVLDGEIKYDL